MKKREGEMAVLGIESSCDETAAAVTVNGTDVRSNIISSQIEIHTQYGGVVPEIASRKHVEKIDSVVREALEQADAELPSRADRDWSVRSWSAFPLQRHLPLQKGCRLSACTILRGISPPTLLSTRSCALPFSAWWLPADILIW